VCAGSRVDLAALPAHCAHVRPYPLVRGRQVIPVSLLTWAAADWTGAAEKWRVAIPGWAAADRERRPNTWRQEEETLKRKQEASIVRIYLAMSFSRRPVLSLFPRLAGVSGLRFAVRLDSLACQMSSGRTTPSCSSDVDCPTMADPPPHAAAAPSAARLHVDDALHAAVEQILRDAQEERAAKRPSRRRRQAEHRTRGVLHRVNCVSSRRSRSSVISPVADEPLKPVTPEVCRHSEQAAFGETLLLFRYHQWPLTMIMSLLSSVQFVTCLHGFVKQLAGTMALDLRAFAHHGRREQVNLDDVLLCARRNDVLRQLMERFCAANKLTRPAAKRKKSTAATAAAAADGTAMDE
jgi:hypothetical protein